VKKSDMLSSGDRVWCTFTIYNILALVFGILGTFINSFPVFL
jgi:hypothetical protein